MRTYRELMVTVNSRLAALRSLERLMNNRIFHDAFANATTFAKHDAISLADFMMADGLKSWLKEQLKKSKTLGERTVVELREIAQQYGIKDYFKMPKAELLSEIIRCNAAS